MKKLPKNNRGFTLLECIVATALASVSMYAITHSSISFLKGTYNLTAHSTQSIQSHRALANVGHDIRMATSTSIDSSGHLNITTVDNKSYTYYTSLVQGIPTLIKRDNDNSVISALATHITDFTVTYPSGNTSTIQIEATFDKNIMGGIDARETVRTRYSRRN